MDRIQKFLSKLNSKQKIIFAKILNDLRVLNLAKYDIKALKGLDDIYRLRKGDIRIIFTKIKGVGIILDIAYRKDIYKK